MSTQQELEAINHALNHPQHHSPWQLYVLRKRKRHLLKQQSVHQPSKHQLKLI